MRKLLLWTFWGWAPVQVPQPLFLVPKSYDEHPFLNGIHPPPPSSLTATFIARNPKAWKVKSGLLQNEEPRCAKTL